MFDKIKRFFLGWQPELHKWYMSNRVGSKEKEGYGGNYRIIPRPPEDPIEF